jgi:hypothetical protein
MCVSMGQAEFSGTTLYCGRLHHPEHGLVHVVGYQNTAANLADGPNAMLLHLPTYAMNRNNFLSVGHSSDVMKRMVDAVRPAPVVTRGGMLWMGSVPAGVVEIFEHDVYTVLLARDPRAVPAALAEVPPHKRPELQGSLMEFYAERYPGYAIAVCCFDNAQAEQAKPLFLWYPPIDPDLLTLPALDCHTGDVPDLDSPVPVDHWVLFGTDAAPAGWGNPVKYGSGLPHRLREFLPDTVVGDYFGGGLRNGDFAITHDDLLAGDLSRVTRLHPGR